MTLNPTSASELDRYIKDELPEMLQVVTESRLRRLELQQGDVSLTIRRAASGEGMEITSILGNGDAGESVAAGRKPEIPTKVITSPMVGTFYHSEQPDRAPLVSEGSRVDQGALIGVIEALQVMTEVESDAAGTVQKILVADGEPVEYGQPLVEVLIDR